MKFFIVFLFSCLCLASGFKVERYPCEDVEVWVQSCQDESNGDVRNSMLKAMSPKVYQSLICKALKDTSSCADIWSFCKSPPEVAEIKERMVRTKGEEYETNLYHFGVDVSKCGDLIGNVQGDQGPEEMRRREEDNKECSAQETSSTIDDYNTCSSTKYTKAMTQTFHIVLKNRAFTENVIRPHFCEFLKEVDEECGRILIRCLQKEHAAQMTSRHLGELNYKISRQYSGLNLSGCPGEAQEP